MPQDVVLFLNLTGSQSSGKKIQKSKNLGKRTDDNKADYVN